MLLEAMREAVRKIFGPPAPVRGPPPLTAVRPYVPQAIGLRPRTGSADAQMCAQYSTFRANTGCGWPLYIAYLRHREQQLRQEIAALQNELNSIAAEPPFIP
jgi:hypothetical protein